MLDKRNFPYLSSSNIFVSIRDRVESNALPRIPLTRNFNRIRPSRGSTVSTTERNIFPSARENSVWRSSIPRLEENARCCLSASSKGGDRPASPARASKNKRSRDATQERNRCCVRRGGEARSLPRMRNLFTVDEARWEI